MGRCLRQASLSLPTRECQLHMRSSPQSISSDGSGQIVVVDILWLFVFHQYHTLKKEERLYKVKFSYRQPSGRTRAESVPKAR